MASRRPGPGIPRTPDARTEALELLALPPSAVETRLAAGLAVEPAALLSALRDVASRHYHANATEARRIARLSIEIAARSSDPLAIGWSRRTLAESMLFSGRIREAEAAYAEGAQAWREAGALALLGQLLVGRIHVLSLLGRMSEVEREARRAATLLRDAGDRTYLARLEMNLGNIHFQRDRYAESLMHYERATSLFAELRVRDQTVVGLEVNRAVALTQVDRDEEALGLFRKLERDCGRRGFDLLQAQVRMNAAYVHALRGDYDYALAGLAAATTYFRETQHPAFLGNCLTNRAEVYQQLHLHRDALPLAAEAADLFRSEGLRYDQALALSQTALARLGSGDSAGALRDVGAARRLFAHEKNAPREALMDLVAAEVWLQRGQRNRAARLAAAACGAFRSLALPRWEASALSLLLRCDPQPPGSDRIATLRDMVARLPQRTYPLQAATLFEQLGDARAQAGERIMAARAYERAISHLESLRSHAPGEDLKIAFLSGRTHIYDRLLALELAAARPSAARLFEWMERSRAQSLRDRLRMPAPTGRDPRKISLLRRRVMWLQARVSQLELGQAQERHRAAALRRDLGRAEEAWSLEIRAAAEAGGRTARARPGASASRVTPAALAAALPRGYGYLAYHASADVALALVVTPEGCTSLRLAPDLFERVHDRVQRLDFQWSAAALTSSRQDAYAGIDEGSSNALAALRRATDTILRELYDLLWRPLEEAGLLAGRHWIVSPHGPIHRVPLSALLGPHGYLAERTQIVISPSAQVWFHLRRQRRPPRRAFLGGVPNVQLASISTEIESVREHLVDWEVTVDTSPTRAVLDRVAPRAGLLHLATHGHLRGDNPAFSSIRLSDGPFYVHDLRRLRLPGSIVVLTACSAGGAVAPVGDEWIGLARGFLAAGAGTVVASRWPIQDEATGRLMSHFYGALAAGRDTAQSLSDAMRTMMRSHPHPWLWASFNLTGLPLRLPVAERTRYRQTRAACRRHRLPGSPSRADRG